VGTLPLSVVVSRYSSLKQFELLAIATVDFIASFWLFNQVKVKFVVMPFVIMVLLKSRLLSEL
jgi:hypothetical protein